ncbi:MAG: glycosyltransferase [Armatimonadota bacterium]|nr:glycosyltransferase [Armatimonadota bacterium]MDW8289323.1 glycosyltransferase [Armatimonadota bacterium]
MEKVVRESRRHVVFVITSLDAGGAQAQVVRLAGALKQRGWKVSLVSMIPPRLYASELQGAGIFVETLHMRRKVPDPRGVLRLARLLKEWRPDVVHSHMVHANILVRVTRLLVPVPVLVCSIRSVYEGGRLREMLYRLTDPLCDLTTHVCRAGAERFVRVKAVSARRMRYIPNGVDTEIFRPDDAARVQMRAHLGVQDTFVWLAVGRLEPAKDYPTLLHAFEKVARHCSSIKLLLAGEGALRDILKKMVCQLHIEDRVTFLGARQDIPQLMNAADACVMSSAWEGLPNVLLEAHACGLPIVATDVGGNSEVVIDGETGFLVPPRQPEALAQAMRRMMALGTQQRARMGQAGRQHVLQNYNMERIVKQWEELYLDLCSRRNYQLQEKAP